MSERTTANSESRIFRLICSILVIVLGYTLFFGDRYALPTAFTLLTSGNIILMAITGLAAIIMIALGCLAIIEYILNAVGKTLDLLIDEIANDKSKPGNE